MTETAESIGAYDTVVGGPSGLDVAGQSSSPYDLALIFRELVADPVTAAVLTTPAAQVPEVPGRAPGFQIQNQNPLAGYPGMLGGKTGFTDAARHAFVTAAERDGRRLVVSVLDTENQPLRAADQAALLLDWGFTVPGGHRGRGPAGRRRPTWWPRPSPRRSAPRAAAPAEPAAVAPAGDATVAAGGRRAGGGRSGRRRRHGGGPAAGGAAGAPAAARRQRGGPVSGYSRATAQAPVGVCSNSVKCSTRNSAERSASPL